jgi:hypothetical protein
LPQVLTTADDFMLRIAMSVKTFSFDKLEQSIPHDWDNSPSSESRHGELSQLPNLPKQAPDLKRLFGIWTSSLAIFVVRQPFYKRFLWAALMVCLRRST